MKDFAKMKKINIYRRKTSSVFKIIDSIPMIVPVFITGFSIPMMVLLITGNFKSILVWPMSLIVGALLSYFSYTSIYESKIVISKERNIANLLVLSGVVIWILFNCLFSFQHIFMNRDPATYANGGIWLIKHDNIIIDRPILNRGISNISPRSAGISQIQGDKENYHFQGAHLMPAFLGLGGRIGGISFMLHLAPIFGGTAILALYALGREIFKPKWALISTSILATSLPLIYFSRDTYTEPITATFILGSLAILMSAMKNNKHVLWFVAGLMSLAGAMARVDAYMIMAPLLLAIFLYIALLNTKDNKLIKSLILFLTGAFITGFIGWLDLSKLSSGYFLDRTKDFKIMMLAISFSVLLGVLIFVLEQRKQYLTKIVRSNNKMLAKIGAFLVLGVSVVIATQPIWRVSYHGKVKAYMEAMLTGIGIRPITNIVNDISVTRKFAEQAPNWVMWYIGPVIAFASIAGLTLMAYKIIREKKYNLLPFFAVIFSTSIIYLYSPRITPDQIWASRRILPVIMPGLILLGVYAISRLWELPKKRLKGIDPKIPSTALLTLAVISPLAISSPFLLLRENAPSLSRIYDVCKSVPSNATILWVGEGAKTAPQPTRSICNVEASGYLKPKQSENFLPNKETLKEINERSEISNLEPFIAYYGYNGDQAIFNQKQIQSLTLVHNFPTTSIEQTILRPPHSKVTNTVQVYLARINSNGDFKPLIEK